MVMVMFIHFFIQVASLKNGRFHTQISFVLLKRDFVCHFRIFWLFKLMSLKKNLCAFYYNLHSAFHSRHEAGRKWVLFFQDTNGLLFKV